MGGPPQEYMAASAVRDHRRGALHLQYAHGLRKLGWAPAEADIASAYHMRELDALRVEREHWPAQLESVRVLRTCTVMWNGKRLSTRT